VCVRTGFPRYLRELRCLFGLLKVQAALVIRGLCIRGLAIPGLYPSFGIRGLFPQFSADFVSTKELLVI